MAYSCQVHGILSFQFMLFLSFPRRMPFLKNGSKSGSCSARAILWRNMRQHRWYPPAYWVNFHFWIVPLVLNPDFSFEMVESLQGTVAGANWWPVPHCARPGDYPADSRWLSSSHSMAMTMIQYMASIVYCKGNFFIFRDYICLISISFSVSHFGVVRHFEIALRCDGLSLWPIVVFCGHICCTFIGQAMMCVFLLVCWM